MCMFVQVSAGFLCYVALAGLGRLWMEEALDEWMEEALEEWIEEALGEWMGGSLCEWIRQALIEYQPYPLTE